MHIIFLHVYHYFSYIETEYSVNYVLFSRQPIPDELRHFMSADELDNLAEQGTIIGCYSP